MVKKKEGDTIQLQDSGNLFDNDFEMIIRNSLDGFWMNDTEARILDVNDSYCRISGYSREELLMMSIPDLEAVESPDETARHMEKIIREGTDIFETRHRRKDGKIIDLEINAFFSPKNGGRFFALFREITERKQVEKILRRSEEKIRGILDSSPEAITVCDMMGKIVDCNAAAWSLFGYENKKELLDRNIFRFVSGDERTEAIIHARITLTAGLGKSHEYTLTRKDGSRFYAEHNVSLHRDEAGNPSYVVGITKDITERRLAREKLMESEKKFRTLVNTIPMKIFHKDADSVYISCNTSYAGDLKIKPEEIAGKTDFDFYNKKIAEKYRRDDREVLKKGKTVQIEEQYIINGKKSPVQTTKTPVFNDAGKVTGILGIFWDISLRKKAEKELEGYRRELEKLVNQRTSELRKANKSLLQEIDERKQAEEARDLLEEQLRHAHKMEAIGMLAGGIAHNFNNILGAIIGYTELAMLDSPGDSTILSNLEQAMTASFRAKDMVKQMLDFSRKEEKQKSLVNMDDMIHESLELIKSSIPATIELRSGIQDSPSPIMANADQLKQVILNLCTNSLHAMKDSGGVLEIRLREVDIQPGSVGSTVGLDAFKHIEFAFGKFLQLTVSDTGHGMNDKTIQRIFEPYFTTKSVDEGTGMGLAVVHGSVKSHGGDIAVYSEPGKGTTIHILLPLEQEEKPVSAAEPVPKAAPSIAPSKKHERILLIDDHPHLVEMMKQMLEKNGYKVVGKTDPFDAMTVFTTYPEQFDVIITDQTMPGMTGIQLTKKVRLIRKEIPVILCTGFSDNVNKENSESKGIDAFLMKPIALGDITAAIRQVLNKTS